MVLCVLRVVMVDIINSLCFCTMLTIGLWIVSVLINRLLTSLKKKTAGKLNTFYFWKAQISFISTWSCETTFCAKKENCELNLDQQLGQLLWQNIMTYCCNIDLCGHQAFSQKSPWWWIGHDIYRTKWFQAQPRSSRVFGDFYVVSIQNQMISICSDIIGSEILDKIHKSSFSVIADEASADSPNVEQLTIMFAFLKMVSHVKFLIYRSLLNRLEHRTPREICECGLCSP